MKITTPIPAHVSENIDKLLAWDRYSHDFETGRPSVCQMPTYEFIARQRLNKKTPITCQAKELIEIIGMIRVGTVTLESLDEVVNFAMLVTVADYFVCYGTGKCEMNN